MRDVWLGQPLSAGLSADMATGLLIAAPGCAVNRLPVPVRAGQRLRAKRPGMRFRVFFYGPEVEDRLLFTYDYQPEANWATYSPGESSPLPSEDERVAPRDGYVRLSADFTPPKGAEVSFSELFDAGDGDFGPDPAFRARLRDAALAAARRADVLRGPDDAVFLLLTDSHYATGCNWDDTVFSLRAAAEGLRPDGVIHLGDFTDGLLPLKLTRRIVRAMTEDLRAVCGRLLVCLGNHDRNYFHGNPERMGPREVSALYLGGGKPDYTVDLPEKKLRLLFLDTFDPDRAERYGFSDAGLRKARRALRTLPAGHRIAVFSHVPPSPRIHVWSKTIRGGERLLEMLEDFDRRRPGALLGFVHGHNHADQVWTERAFPVVGVGCSKTEAFAEHKPEGAVTPPRRPGEVTQELWDVLVISAARGTMDFVRFGAGEDRRIGPGAAESAKGGRQAT